MHQEEPPQATIRPETPADVEAIHALTEAAFLHAPHTEHTEQFIVRALREARVLTLSLVAELEGAVVGHVAVSPVDISDGSSGWFGWFGLGPISVSPALQGRGIGSRLMQAALQELRLRGAGGCVLLGDPAFYARFGFRPLPGLWLAEVPPEYFQALCLGAQQPQGEVRYHPAFAARA